MVNGIPGVHAMFRRKAAAVVAQAKAAARQGGEEVAQAMRYLAPEDDGNLKRSIRVEEADTVKLSGGPKGAYARRKGNKSAGSGTNQTANFIGVVVKAGNETTLVSGEKAGKKSGVRRGTIFQNARLQEFGTKNMAANPFFFPAWRANRTRVRAAITRSVRKAWTSE